MGSGQGIFGLDVENAARLAAAYERVVSILSLDDSSSLPPRARTELLKAMLSHGQAHAFDEHRLALAGLASAPRIDHRQDSHAFV